MSSLLDDLASHLQGDTLSQISRQLGTDEARTSQAIAMALPMLVGGLAHETTTPDGAQSLNRALEEDHDGSLLENASPLFGIGTAGAADVAVPRALNGAGILGHILGGRRTHVEQGIGQATGLNSQQTGRLLMMLAPLVMAYLARRKKQGADANAINAELQAGRREVERRSPDLGGLLGQMFGAGGENRPGIADDLARLAPKVLGGLFGGRS